MGQLSVCSYDEAMTYYIQRDGEWANCQCVAMMRR